MNHADFARMVRAGKRASIRNRKSYRRAVAAFTGLGLGWLLISLGLAVAGLTWAVVHLLQGQISFGGVIAVLLLTVVSWVAGCALRVRLDPPRGIEVTALEAPALFEALECMRRKIGAPLIHHVYLNDECNVSIQSIPRFGLLGRDVHHLTIGLPLLMAMNQQRFLAVIAHEYGHLRQGPGGFSAWVYRTRIGWLRVHHGLQDQRNMWLGPTQALFRWYVPRLVARTFAMARQEEYRADRIASKVMGREVTAAALLESQVKSDWLSGDFWREHWCRAAHSLEPVGPFKSMRKRLAEPPDTTFAIDALRQAVKRESTLDDTHPSLGRRLQALEQPPSLPAWSQSGALELLGKDAKQWIASFDAQWIQENAQEWKHHHQWLSIARLRVADLKAKWDITTPNEKVELARLMRKLDPTVPVREIYESALSQNAAHPGALRGLITCLSGKERRLKLECLQCLWELGSTDASWASRQALAELETSREGLSHDGVAYKLWRRRLAKAAMAEEQARSELKAGWIFTQTMRHELGDFELEDLRAELLRWQGIAACWVVRKQLMAMPERPAFLVFLHLPVTPREHRQNLCRMVERSVSLPGPVLVLPVGEAIGLSHIKRMAFEPVFIR